MFCSTAWQMPSGSRSLSASSLAEHCKIPPLSKFHFGNPTSTNQINCLIPHKKRYNFMLINDNQKWIPSSCVSWSNVVWKWEVNEKHKLVHPFKLYSTLNQFYLIELETVSTQLTMPFFSYKTLEEVSVPSTIASFDSLIQQSFVAAKHERFHIKYCTN